MPREKSLFLRFYYIDNRVNPLTTELAFAILSHDFSNNQFDEY